MKDGRPQDIPERGRAAQTLLRRIGVAILIAGLCASALVFVMAPAADESGADASSALSVTTVDNSKRYQLELERIGGKSAVLAAEFDDWFTSLWHGARLAGTLAILSLGASLLCFWAARIPPREDGEPER